MFKRDVQRWCAVDIKDDTGPIRRGVVCDVLPLEGIIVDFNYPDHHADFVPFTASITLPHKLPTWYERLHKTWYYVGDPVETLYRRSPEHPWCWYPSTLLVGGSYDTYAFVEIECEGEVVQAVMPAGRVRRMDKSSGLRWGAWGVGEIYKHQLVLPSVTADLELLAVSRRTDFLEMWESETDTKVAMANGYELEYLSTNMDALPMCDVERILRSIAKEYAYSDKRGKKRRVDAIVSPNPDSSTFFPDSMSILDHDTVCEVFSYLDIDTLNTIRRVSQSWNDLIQTASTTQATINLKKCGYTTHGYHTLATILHRTLTKSTKWLILIGNGGRPMLDRLRTDTLTTVTDMVRAMNVQLRMVVLSGRMLSAPDLFAEFDASYFGPDKPCVSRWRGVCDKLVLDNVEMPVAEFGVVHVERAAMGSGEGDIMRALDRLCPEMDGTERTMLELRLQMDWDHVEGRERILSILKRYQLEDKRFSPEELPVQISLDNLPRLATLNNITVWALLAKYFSGPFFRSNFS